MDGFIKWFASLAPEGETALVVRQKPQLLDGELQFHKDGAVKAFWPAFLPSHKIRDGQSWYGNTGSFILDRMQDGISAARANCEYVLVLMLDDVGTKSKVPPLPPTWVIETSKGNFQWGYAFGEQPTKAAFVAAVKAIAAAGYTDAGAGNPVRNFRLPGSVNLKPGKEKFASALVEFHPEREFTLEEICAALGVTPGPDEPDGYQALKLKDDGGDDVASWLSENGLVLAPPNASGWMGVVCPQADQHSDGNPEGRYSPSLRAFCCYHSSCEQLDSVRFLEWVGAQGGPSAVYGLRDELVATQLGAALDRIRPTQAYPDEAARVVAQVERKEAGRVEKAGWYERFAYLHSDDGYFDLTARKQYSRSNFDSVFRHVACYSIHVSASGKPRKIEASKSFDENREAMGARVLQGVTYAPGQGVLVARAGDVYANMWRDARPAGVPGDVAPWLAHAERLVPDQAEREHLLDWMAHKVQHPSIKVNHGVLHAGNQGSGKDTLWDPFLYAVGGASRENIGTVRNEEINSQWGYALLSEVLVINELRQTDASDRRALENRLKPLLAAPPELLSVNRKGLHPFDALNRLAVVAFSNERVAITLTSDDRRWFVLWSEAPRMGPREAARLWQWYDAGGRDAVAAWLRARDVSGFMPGAAPEATEAKAIMLHASLSPVEAVLVEMMQERRGEFSLGAVQGPWQQLCDRLTGYVPAGSRVSVYALFNAFREAGWLDLGRVKTIEHASKVHVFCAPDVLTKFDGNRSEVRRSLDRAKAGPLKVVS